MWNGNLEDIEQVVLYMNTELKKGRSQKEIEINDFKVNEKVIRNRLIRKGYKKDITINQWLLEDKEHDNTKEINGQQLKKKEYDKGNTLVITDEKMKNNIIDLAKHYDKIMNIIQEYDNKYDKEYDGMTIELPLETKKDFRTSIRINNVIWEQFNEFAEDHKEFTKRDLLSMALKEYMEKYK